METMHKYKWCNLYGGFDCRLVSYQVKTKFDLWPVLELIRLDEGKEIPFSGKAFYHWAEKSLLDPNTLILICLSNKNPVGFVIAFGPWELESGVFVFFAYVRADCRCGGPVWVGLDFLRGWARGRGAKQINFETNRPRAWRGILDRSWNKSKVMKEI